MSERWIRSSAIAVFCAAMLAGVPASANATWTKEATVNPSTSGENELGEVSCWSAGKCVAVGLWLDESTSKVEPLVERLSGGTWTKETAPMPKTAKKGILNGVSCPTAEFCLASGGYESSGGSETAFEDEYTSASKEWKLVTVSLPGTALASLFVRVSCSSETMCMTVGAYEKTGPEVVPFAEHWTKSGSSLEYPPGVTEGVLIGVSCVYAGECMAVGWTNNAVLSDRWHEGTWSQTTSAS
jgi:hypothetical protein